MTGDEPVKGGAASSDVQQMMVAPESDVASAIAFIKGAIEDPTYLCWGA
jgi:hypothetical protein